MILLTRHANNVTVLMHCSDCQTRGTNNFYIPTNYIRNRYRCVVKMKKSWTLSGSTEP